MHGQKRRAGGRGEFPRPLLEDASASLQKVEGGGSGNGKQSMCGVRGAATHRHRPVVEAVEPQRAQAGRGPDHVGDGVPRAHLVELHRIRGAAVKTSLHLGQAGEGAPRAVAHRRVQQCAVEKSDDLRVGAVNPMVVLIVSMGVRRGIDRAAGLVNESAVQKHVDLDPAKPGPSHLARAQVETLAPHRAHRVAQRVQRGAGVQKDLGSSLLFFTLFVVMMWVATERVSYLVAGVALFAGAAYFAWTQFGHVQTRVSIWLDPWADPLDDGYQIIQGIYGLADGGLTGTGLGRGNQGQVPYAENDFIFAAIGEEWGLIGASAVLMAYVLIVGAGLRIALRADRTFEKLLAVGLTTIVGVQAFVIVGGVIKVVPLTGITLPFVSYGGSSLIANYVLLALLIRLSDSSARRLGELPDDPTPSERSAAWRLGRRQRREARRAAA